MTTPTTFRRTDAPGWPSAPGSAAREGNYSRRSLGAATPNCGGGVAANPRILPATSPVCVLLTGQLRPARFGGRAAFSVR